MYQPQARYFSYVISWNPSSPRKIFAEACLSFTHFIHSFDKCLQSAYCGLVVVLGTGSAAAAAKSLQSCPTLCDPIDGSPPGCPDPGILQARTLEWVAISFSNA